MLKKRYQSVRPAFRDLLVAQTTDTISKTAVLQKNAPIAIRRVIAIVREEA
jgi:hypothetical protein